MLWMTSTINSYEIEATDGEAGLLTDLLCDASWKLQSMVIKTGEASPVETALLPASALTSIDRELGKIHVKLSSQAAVQTPPHADDALASNGLMSLNQMRGWAIEASDGAIGSVVDFLLNDTDWRIRYLVVDTGTWLSSQKVLIAPHSIAGIAADVKQFNLKIDRDKVKNAPLYDPSKTIDGVFDEKFLTYYGIRWLEG
jgi:hypothetical protein